jgi:uncharacterized protein (TIGR04141 family)
MLQALDVAGDGQDGYEITHPTVLGVPALWTNGIRQNRASWCADASATTGLPMSYVDRHSGGVLVLAVDGEVYALGYGAGRWLIKDEFKEQDFGIQFAVRQLEPGKVHRVVQRRPGSRGRQDSTLVPDGLPIWCYGIESYAGIVGHLGGEIRSCNLTFGSNQTSREPRIDGSAGLSLRLGVQPADLVSDIRQIAAICGAEPADPSLRQLIAITPVPPGHIADQLHDELDEILSWDAAAAADFIAPVVPTARHDEYLASESIKLRIGEATRRADGIELADILAGTRFRPAGTRVATLRGGTVVLYSDPDATQVIGQSKAINWIEATQSVGANRYFLLDGKWYQIGETYLDSIREQIRQLIPAQVGYDLPTWDQTWAERRYNQHVQDTRPGYINLDANLVRAGLHTNPGFEACDLLGPDNELIFNKRAEGSEPLSHLFSQAYVSVQTIINNPDAQVRLAEKVKLASSGRRELALPFSPAKVVFGILLKNGKTLTPDTLFPFSQVTLAQTARELQTRHHITVEAIPIHAESSNVTIGRRDHP